MVENIEVDKIDQILQNWPEYIESTESTKIDSKTLLTKLENILIICNVLSISTSQLVFSQAYFSGANSCLMVVRHGPKLGCPAMANGFSTTEPSKCTRICTRIWGGPMWVPGYPMNRFWMSILRPRDVWKFLIRDYWIPSYLRNVILSSRQLASTRVNLANIALFTSRILCAEVFWSHIFECRTFYPLNIFSFLL